MSGSQGVKVLGYAILCVGAIAFTITNTQATQANQPEPVVETTSPYSRTRHVIALTINQLDELKVTEGQRINEGDIISDRNSSRTKLLDKQQRLETAISKASLPLNQLKPLPVPKFQGELAALKQAQFNLDAIVQQINSFDKNFHHKDPWHVQVFQSDKVQQLANLKRREVEASLAVERAIARIDEAKLTYQKQQYEHSLKVSDYQTALQKRQEQVNSLQLQLDKVNDELATLVSVYSPYRGKVRRVKVVGQSDRDINVEVTLDIREASFGRSH